jgi:cytochrome c551/c552
MKRMAFVMTVVAMAGCAKGEQKPAAAPPDTSHMMMMSDTSHMMMMSDSSKMKMAAPTAQMSADSTSAERGATLYKNKGCAACHNIAKTGETPHRRPGGKQSGPDLGGVTERRDRAWLRRFLKDPDAMLASDPIAIAMLTQAKNLKMPNMKLSDAEIEALINYLAVKQ